MSGRVIIAELIGSNTCTATATGITVSGAAPVLTLCRRLIAAGHDPNTPLEAYRGAILCLRVRSLAEGAALTVHEAEGKPRFAPYRAFPDGQQCCAGLARNDFEPRPLSATPSSTERSI